MPRRVLYSEPLIWTSLVVFSLSCADNSTAPSPRPARIEVPVTSNADTTESEVRPRYTVAIDVIGGVKLGEPITLRARVRSHGAVKEAEIAIAFPDLAALRSETFDLVNPHVERRIKPSYLARRAFQDGGSAQLVSDAIITTPGIYRAIATVKTLSDEPRLPNTPSVQESAHDQIWLVIDSTQGHVFRQLDQSSIPRGWAAVPGPRHLRKPGGVSPFLIQCGDPGADPSCDPTSGGGPGGTYTLTVQWYNSYIYSFLPIQQAAYEATDGINTYSGLTDENGRIYLPCSYGAYSIVVDYRTPDKTQIQRANVTIHALTYQSTTNACSSTPSEVFSTFDYNAAKVFDDMRTAVDSSRAFFSFTRSSVTVNLIDGAPPTERSYYSPDQDKIWFKAGDIDGPQGVFTAAHEYGHALAEQSMSGARAGGCPTTHYIDGYYTLRCALSEGFADYHAVAIRGAATNSYYFAIRANGYYHGGDGSIDEGAVAAFLFDMTARSFESDFVAGTDYAQHYPARYVGEQMAGCFFYPDYFSGYFRADGIDAMIYCFEAAVDPNARANYFSTRVGTILSEFTYASNPASWNAANIRRLWLNKLYAQ